MSYTPDLNTLEKLFMTAFQASLKAGIKIMEVFHSEEDQITMKSDNTPVSLADRLAHNIIREELSHTRIPILSEEGRDLIYEERKSWDVMWIVDPLDATRQFIKKGKDFTVNIALVIDNYPLFGIIYAPALGVLYFGLSRKGSRRMEITDPKMHITQPFSAIMKGSLLLPCIPKRDNYVIITSSNHTTNETLDYIAQLRSKCPEKDIIHQSLNSSLKMCLIADGQADLYVRFSTTYEWDTAAGQAIVEGVRGSLKSADTQERLIYNQESLTNPPFICTIDPQNRS